MAALPAVIEDDHHSLRPQAIAFTEVFGGHGPSSFWTRLCTSAASAMSH
jgi:hypothetical protein